MMIRMIQRIEDKAVRRYGFEAPQTIATFKLTEIIRKMFGLGYEA